MLFNSVTGTERGALILIGGGEDRRQEMTVLRKVVSVSRAQKIAVIPTATSYARECGETYINAFRQIGVDRVVVVDVRYRDEADDDRFVSQLEGADCVFFTGGDQVRLVEILNETRLLAEVRRMFAAGVCIAGTSAGAAAASQPMIFSWSDEDFLFTKNCVTYGDGFGFVENVVVDTHFIERGRIPRLSQILASGVSKIGIGVAEDTAAILYSDNRLEVAGSGLITIITANGRLFTNYHDISDDDPVAVDGLNLTFLTEGTVYDLNRCVAGFLPPDRKGGDKVKVPLESSFGFIPKFTGMGGWS
ncbi:MAG: cyanophycinase [Negativicutes bacterium]|nr:cyanophycinase [Negativicutes bacterium]